MLSVILSPAAGGNHKREPQAGTANRAKDPFHEKRIIKLPMPDAEYDGKTMRLK